MMINLKLFAQCGDHSIIQICTVVRDDPVWNTIPTYEILLDKAGNHIFSDRGATNGGPSNWTAKDFTPITFVTQ